MMRILSCEHIKEIEDIANKNGITYLRLMENAGAACAKVIRNKFDNTEVKTVTVVCGKGKNGGDGFVIARKLNENGYSVNVLLAMGMPNADIAVEMCSRLEKLDVNVEVYDCNNSQQIKRLQNSEIIVDCIFGSGFSGAVNERISTLINRISESKGYVISVDLPSGLCADSSEVTSAVVKADLTIAIMALKYSLVYFPSANYAGEIKVVSIGIPEEIFDNFRGGFSLNMADVKTLFKKRNENSHKGDYGKGFIIAGSYEMPGAAMLCSSSAVECGAGLIKLACNEKIVSTVMNKTAEKVLLPLNCDENGQIFLSELPKIISEIEKSTCVLVGCGMGNSLNTREIVKTVLQNSEVPVILDADGINAVCENIDIIRACKSTVVLTPHPGEAARLLGCTIEEIEKNRILSARELYNKTGAIIVLKGSRTVVTGNGKDFYINMTGNPGMATAGSGDVLSGMILSFICQKMKPMHACMSAVYIHGACGDLVAAKYSQMSTTPTKMIDCLGKLLSNFE